MSPRRRMLTPATLPEIRGAARRLAPYLLRSPLVRLNHDLVGSAIYLKLENLQPIGSFKIRPSGNAMLCADEALLSKGVYTASSGNMAQGVGYMASKLGLACTALLTPKAAASKVEALVRLGVRMRTLDLDEWWRVLDEHRHPDMEGLFVHPVAHPDVIAGDATIGLEIVESLPSVDTVVVPYGGGGLSCGIASAIKALKPEVRVYAAESDHCAPLAASLKAGRPVELAVADSFVTGLGVGRVVEEMFALARRLIDGALVASTREIADGIRLLLERQRILAEGAGAVALACALSGKAGTGNIVCVVSGGNLDRQYLTEILAGRLPKP